MNRTRAYGITLLELLIAMAVAAVLLSLAVPSVVSAVRNQQMQSVLGPVSMAAYTARSEATKSGDNMTICARATDSQCGTDWNNGLLVFRDNYFIWDETVAVVDPDDEIVRITPAHDSDVELSAMASTDRTGNGVFKPYFLRYGPGGGASWETGTFVVCDSRGAAFARALHITISGDIRPARQLMSETGPVIKDIFGRNITCAGTENERGSSA